MAPAYPTLRERVSAVLLAAGFKDRQDTIPGLLSGGTFDLISGEGVAVRAEWWDAPEGERRALLESFAGVLERAGFGVARRGDALFVSEPEERGEE